MGVSNVSVAQLRLARAIVPVVSVQNRFNLEDRRSDEVLEECESEGLGFIPWFPLSRGALAEPGSAATEIAKRHEATPAQIAIAWLLQRSPAMLPIPGTASIDHLEENVAAARIRLSDEEMATLSAAAN